MQDQEPSCIGGGVSVDRVRMRWGMTEGVPEYLELCSFTVYMGRKLLEKWHRAKSWVCIHRGGVHRVD